MWFITLPEEHTVLPQEHGAAAKNLITALGSSVSPITIQLFPAKSTIFHQPFQKLYAPLSLGHFTRGVGHGNAFYVTLQLALMDYAKAW